MSISPELYDFIVKVVEDKVKEIRVTREEFDKLRSEVIKLADAQRQTEISIKELIEAQKRSEERLTRLENIVADLIEAQKRTEQRVEELAEAQKRTEQRVEELAEAQKRTEQRVEELAEAQKRTEQRVEELAEAQKRTEKRLDRVEAAIEKLVKTQNELTQAVKHLSGEVGALSSTIGFGLEDIARVVVPGWLSRHEQIEVEELERKFLKVDGEEIELNLYGVGESRGEKVIVVGECKTRIYESEVRKFAKVIERVKKEFKGRELYPLMFGFLIHPSAEREAKKHGIRLIVSYAR